MEDLKSLRKKIDEIDERLVELFEERMEIVRKIALYKIKRRLPIFDANREEQVVARNIEKLKNKKFKNEVEEFTVKLMELSKQIQKREFEKMT